MIGAAGILLGFVIEAALSWPAPLYAKIGHPVSWIGRAIRMIEARLNSADTSPARLRLLGGVGVCLVLALAVLPAIVVAVLLPSGWAGYVVGGLLAWPFLAPRSLFDHVQAVATPLIQGDIAGARYAVSMIIGRDPDQLDAAAIARASIESLAENASDGVVAPVFWGVLLGLPGLVAYKAINTMDSMIGHRSARYRHYGMVAARLDDLVPFWESDPDEWRRWMATNFDGVLNCTRHAMPLMVNSGYGRIVTVISDAGRVGEPHLAVYSGAKAGAAGFMRAIAKAGGRFGITANCVALGGTRTPAVADLIPDAETEKRALSQYVIRRLGEPEDPAGMILFLCSDAASWITGQTYPVNGGYSFAC